MTERFIGVRSRILLRKGVLTVDDGVLQFAKSYPDIARLRTAADVMTPVEARYQLLKVIGLLVPVSLLAAAVATKAQVTWIAWGLLAPLAGTLLWLGTVSLNQR